MSNERVIIGLGSGRCGMRSLAALLSRQPNSASTHQEWPLLPWKTTDRSGVKLGAKFARMQREREAVVVADTCSSYLPYVETLLASGRKDVYFPCLRRDRSETIHSFVRWLDKVQSLPTNHWSARPAPGWYHDPIISRLFPKYEITNREQAIGRYWDEYYAKAEELARRYPERVRIFESVPTLNSPEGQHELLSFLGYSQESHVLCPGLSEYATANAQQRMGPAKFASHADDPKRCIILVPFTGSIVPGCEDSLRQLERKGYTVRRVGGYAAIDQGRNQMATDALAEGYEETMWIDSDVVFSPDAVDQIRSHRMPICCGIYPQKGRQALACHVAMGSKKITFGQQGGLEEILYAATGFLHIRREVYEQIQLRLDLPVCNERFRHPTIPFFAPMIHEIDEGHWYLAEDYAFSQRVRDCGYKIYADTSIRLWHVGTYSYGWEDAGMRAPRYDSFTLNFGDVPPKPKPPQTSVGESYAEDQDPEMKQPQAGDLNASSEIEAAQGVTGVPTQETKFESASGVDSVSNNASEQQVAYEESA